MHEGFSLDTEFLWEFGIGSLVAFLAWLINWVRAMSERKIDKLETLHESNARSIIDVERRVAVVESNYIKKEDVRLVVDAMREELYCDLDNSFKRVHERFDNLFDTKTVKAPDRRYPSEAPLVTLGDK